MNRFLEETKYSLQHLTKDANVHIVLGNEACDVDSAVSALVYAFYLYKENIHPDTLVLPVLDVHRHEVHLKTDIVHLFKESDLPLELLTFRDDVDLKKINNTCKLSLTLVDHNTLSRKYSELKFCVIEVIDHHQKETEYDLTRCNVTIEKVGSCCTLIAEIIILKKPEILDSQLTLLLYGPILLDTVCLGDKAQRATAKDKTIITELENILGRVDRDAFYQKLLKAKKNMSNFTMEELLNRDYKVIFNNTMSISISSLVTLLEEVLKRPDAESGLKTFSLKTNSQIVILMSFQADEITQEVKRQLAIYSEVQGYREQLVDILETASLGGPVLHLQLLESPLPSVILYNQGNIAASRKVIIPLLNTFLRGDQSQTMPINSCSSATNCQKETFNKGLTCESKSEEEDLGIFDPLASESEDVLDSLTNSVSHLHVLGMGDPISHAGSSQSSSNQNSCPYTPQNSCTDGGLEMDPYARQILPSFNSREMMEKIESKRGKLRGYEGDGEGDNGSYPFTPKNSFVDNSFESYIKDVSSLDSGDFLLKVNEKVSTMSMSDSNDGIGNISMEVPVIDYPQDIKSLKNGETHKADMKEECSDVENKSDENHDGLNHPRIETCPASHQCKGPDDKDGIQSCPEAVSLSDKLEKSEEKMDISDTSGSSEKASPLPNDTEIQGTTITTTTTTADILTNTEQTTGTDNFSTAATGTNNTKSTAVLNDHHQNERKRDPTRSESTTSNNVRTSSTASVGSLTGDDVDLELPSNYQTETVDFPDSPGQLKLMNQSTHELQGTSLDDPLPDEDNDTEQPDDDVFRAVLSPSSEGAKLKKERPSTLSTSGKKKRKIKVNPDILNVADDIDDKSLSSLSNASEVEDIMSPIDDIATPDDIETPDDLEDSTYSPSEQIEEVSAAEERDDERRWRTCVISGLQRKIDMKVIEPYKKVLSHGGYYGPKRSAIIVFCACYLPDHSRKDYDYVMDNLFLYVLTTLDQLVAEDYMLVYLHGAMDRNNMPTFGWLKRCYQMIDRRLRKNLKGLYLVHPTFWLKTIVIMTRPFISSKFSRKLQFVNSLQELEELVPIDQMSIPDRVKQLEFEIMIKEKKKNLKSHK